MNATLSAVSPDQVVEVTLLSEDDLARMEGGYVPMPPLAWVLLGGAGGLVAGVVAGVVWYVITH